MLDSAPESVEEILVSHLYSCRQGIAVDSHVQNWAVVLGWVPEEANQSAEFIRAALQFWIPSAMWGDVNTTLASLGQCLQSKTKTEHLLMFAEDGIFEKAVPIIKKFIEFVPKAASET